MKGQENLIPIRTHEDAVEKGRAGGLKPKVRWNFRKYCSKNCKFFKTCPAVSISLSKKKHPCFIKSINQEAQNTFINLFEDGEVGLVKEALKLYYKLVDKLGKNVKPKELMSAIETTMTLKKGIYGDKGGGNQTIVNVVVIPQEIKEV